MKIVQESSIHTLSTFEMDEKQAIFSRYHNKWFKSAVLLLHQVSFNKEHDRQNDNPKLQTLGKQIEFFKTGDKEIACKVRNKEFYKKYYYESYALLDQLRSEWSEIKQGKTEEDIYQFYDQYIHQAICNTLNNLFEQYGNQLQELRKQPLLLHRSIVWGIPCEHGGEDDFIYSGKSPTKTVFVPYKAIHYKLAASNWIMRGCKDNSSNYLIGHMLFVVSKGSCMNHSDGEKCINSREFIDFPIIAPFSILTEMQDCNTNDDFRSLMTRYENPNGRYLFSPSGKHGSDNHSENALVEFLKTDASVEGIVNCLKDKLALKYQSAEGCKIYAITIFINSQKNVCSWCEPLLYDLMNSSNEGSFRSKMKAAMQERGIITSNQAKKPYIMITVSVREYYYESGQHYYFPQKPYSFTLQEDARLALNGESKIQFSLDIKHIANKVILSTAEKWLEEGLQNISQYTIESIRVIPCYSGFRSATGADNRLSEVIKEKGMESRYLELEYERPHCFDDTSIAGEIYEI